MLEYKKQILEAAFFEALSEVIQEADPRLSPQQQKAQLKQQFAQPQPQQSEFERDPVTGKLLTSFESQQKRQSQMSQQQAAQPAITRASIPGLAQAEQFAQQMGIDPTSIFPQVKKAMQKGMQADPMAIVNQLAKFRAQTFNPAQAMKPQIPAPFQTSPGMNKPSFQSLKARTTAKPQQKGLPLDPSKLSKLRKAQTEMKSEAKKIAKEYILEMLKEGASLEDLKSKFGYQPSGQLSGPGLEVALKKAGIHPQKFMHLKKKLAQQGKNISDEQLVAFLQKQSMFPSRSEMRSQTKYRSGGVTKPAFDWDPMMPEGKISMSKEQFEHTIKEALLVHEKNKMIKRFVNEQINEQKEVANLAEHLLCEGPLSNVWGGIKGAVQGAKQGAKQAFGQMQQGFATGQQQAQQQQQAKEAQKISLAAQKEIANALKSVNRARDAYTRGAMKNKTDMQQYHDAVLMAKQVFDQIKDQSLAWAPGTVEKMTQEVSQSIQRLYADLTDEQKSIAAFMKSLKNGQPSQVQNEEDVVTGPSRPGAQGIAQAQEAKKAKKEKSKKSKKSK